MESIKSLPLDEVHSVERPPASRRVERSAIMTPSREIKLRPSEVDTAANGFIQTTENHERQTFSTQLAFELTGVIWNRKTRNQAESDRERSRTNGDKLLSRLLPLLNENPEVRFVFKGGAGSKFTWTIHGTTRESSTREAALAAAARLRGNFKMILASETNFRFAPKVLSHDVHQSNGALTICGVMPRFVSLTVPPQASPGFAASQHPTKSCSTTIRVAFPKQTQQSFESLSEAVILSPVVIQLALVFTRFSLDGPAIARVADALDWIERSPVAFWRQFNGVYVEPGLVSGFQKELRRWLKNPVGLRLDCYSSSDAALSDSVVRIVGQDVYGTQVETAPLLNPSHRAHPETNRADDAVLDFSRCIHPDAAWPSVFPTYSTVLKTPVLRFFNLDRPRLDTTGICLGHIAEDPIDAVRVTEADRSQHFYVVGATGTGKSTLLFNMLLQDIRNGHGVGLIDPHGDLYDQLLEAMPISRAQDVVLFNPDSSDCAPGFNPLETHGPNPSLQVSFVINELLKTFERLYDMRVCGGPMFETYFRNAMLLLMESGLDEVALTEIPLVFEDGDYRKFLKRRCKNPLVISFWNEQAEKVKGDSALENMAPYIASKINSFISSGVIRPIIGQAKSTINFGQVMDNCGILLVKISKGVLGELDAQLLGSLLVSKLLTAALARANMNRGKRRPFYLYVDEFQNFTNDTVAHMLSEVRKYGLHLTLANQNLSQLHAHHGRQNVLDSVLGNVGNLVFFRVGPIDAERLLPYVEPEFGSIDLQGLPNFHAAGRLMTESGPTRPFVFRTLASATPQGYRRAKPFVWEIRKMLCTKPIAEVETQITRRRTSHKHTGAL